MTEPQENAGLPGPAQETSPQEQPTLQEPSGVEVATQPPTGEGSPTEPVPENSQPPSATPEAQYQYHGPHGIQFYLSVLVIVLYMTTFVLQAIRIPSESMETTLMIGDFLLADKIHYSAEGWFGRDFLPYREIRRGDIVVFHFPPDPKQYFVKRVIGLPGDHIKLLDKAVLVNGQRLEEDYARHVLRDYNPYRDSFPDVTFIAPPYLTSDVDRRWRTQLFRYLDHGEIVVPPGNYFVMGDNRDRSLDSRYWGFVPRGNITGRPLVIYLSVNQPGETEAAMPDDKLFHPGKMLAHILQFARWDRMFRPVY